MKQLKKHVLSLGLFLLLFLLTFYFIFSKYPVSEFLSSLKNCNPQNIFIAFLCVIFYLLFGSLFLKKIMKSLKSPISFFHSLCYCAIEIYFSAITPSSTGGQPAEIYYMSKSGIPLEKSTIAIFINTILYKLVIVILLLISIIVFPKRILGNGILFNSLMLLGMGLNILAISFFTCLLFSKKLPSKIIKSVVKLLKKAHIIKKEKQEALDRKSETLITEYHSYAFFIKQNRVLLWKLFFIILLQRICLFSVSYFVYRAFGLQEYNYLQIVLFQIAITSAIDSVPSPGGVMIGEGLTFQIHTLIYGSTFALSSMLLLRGISFYFLVLICSFLYLYYHFFGRKKEV